MGLRVLDFGFGVYIRLGVALFGFGLWVDFDSRYKVEL